MITLPVGGDLWCRYFTSQDYTGLGQFGHIVRLEVQGPALRPSALVGAVGRGPGRGRRDRVLWRGEVPSFYPGSGPIRVGRYRAGDQVGFSVFDAQEFETTLSDARTILEHGTELPPFRDALASDYADIGEVQAPWWVARYELTAEYVGGTVDFNDGWLYMWVVVA